MRKASFFLGLLFLSACGASPQQGNTQAKAQTYSLLPYPSGLFGFNTGSTFFNVHPDKPGEMDAARAWLDSLGPQVLRFPGGSDANYFHYPAPGYGYRIEEYRKTITDEPVEENKRRYDVERSQNYPNGASVVVPFLQLSNYGSGQSSTLFVANLYTGNYEENKVALQALQSGGATISGIELGNEMYLGYYRDTFPNVETYIARAKDFTVRFRADFSGIKIGAVAAPPRTFQTIQTTFNQEWNAALAQESFYDAVIVHHYVNFDECGLADSGQPAWNCKRDSLFREATIMLPTILDRYHALFPGKQIWMTEWNLARRQFDFMDSQLSNLYYAAYLLEAASWSARNEKLADQFIFHNLLAKGNFPILHAKQNQDQDHSYTPMPAFFVFSMLGSLFNGDTQLLDGPPLYQWQPGNLAKAYQFIKTLPDGKRELVIALINTDGAAKTVEPSVGTAFQLEGTQFTVSGTGRMAIRHGQDLNSGLPGNSPIQLEESSFQNTVTLPPYSIALVEIELE